MTHVRKAARDDAERAGATLASAFAADPLFSWMLGTTAHAEKRIAGFFNGVVKINLSKPEHEVYVTDAGDAAAVWSGIDDWKVSTGDIIRLLPAMLRTFRSRIPVSLKALGAMEKVHPSEPHYYLEFLGTRTDRQGKGLGTALMAPMIDRCDTEGVPAYLESSNPRNESFYVRHGFQRRGEIDTPPGCPRITAMWRDPR